MPSFMIAPITHASSCKLTKKINQPQKPPDLGRLHRIKKLIHLEPKTLSQANLRK